MLRKILFASVLMLGAPAAANSGAALSAMMVPPILSPPTLTGVMPANTWNLPRLLGAM